MNNIDLTPVFQAVIALLAALVTYKLIPWIKTKTTKGQQDNLAAAARIAVYAAEQLYGANHGDEKLEYARQALLAAGYDVNTETMRAAIESAVYSLPIWDKKNELKPPEQQPEIVDE
jgi:hypothetical protein